MTSLLTGPSHQIRMGIGGPTAPPAPPTVRITAVVGSLVEGQTGLFRIIREGNLNIEVRVTWTAVSSRSAADLKAPTTNQEILAPFVASRDINVFTNLITALQGDRDLTVTLSAPIGCTIVSGQGSAVVVISDDPTAVPVNRSGLPWPSGWDPITDGVPSELVSAGNFRGRPVDSSVVFMGGQFSEDQKDSNGNITHVANWNNSGDPNSMCSNNGVVRSGGQIYTLLNAGYKVFHAMPLCLGTERGNNAKRIYEDMMNGTTYRGYYQLMLNRLAAWYSPTDTGLVIRPGWETNKGYPWSWNDMSAIDQPFYQLWMREIYLMIRSTLPSAKISWNHLKDNNGRVKYPRDYPGNDVIDYIGCDLYDNGFSGTGFLINETRWQSAKGAYVTTGSNAGSFYGPQGFLDLVKARRQDPDGGHIQLTFDEWGATPLVKKPDSPPWPADGEQNNTFFPQRMFQFFNDNAQYIGGEHYFNGNIHHRIEPVQDWTTNTRAGYLAAWHP